MAVVRLLSSILTQWPVVWRLCSSKEIKCQINRFAAYFQTFLSVLVRIFVYFVYSGSYARLILLQIWHTGGECARVGTQEPGNCSLLLLLLQFLPPAHLSPVSSFNFLHSNSFANNNKHYKHCLGTGLLRF